MIIISVRGYKNRWRALIVDGDIDGARYLNKHGYGCGCNESDYQMPSRRQVIRVLKKKFPSIQKGTKSNLPTRFHFLLGDQLLNEEETPFIVP